ncbi:unnamed protein product [Sphagnum jensenii]|uniref:40S ribosomal protein S8 n=1 Tax=Sphagnum jensenii TaxID=128206 RepID=A0ABP0VB05_9BRYO
MTVATRKTRVLDVLYNASNNELVRTKTLVKNSIIQIDATPFRTWYEQHYGVKIGVKKSKAKSATAEETVVKHSSHVTRKLEERQKTRTLDPALDDQFVSGRLLACISSRPGQSGRCDGTKAVLEGCDLSMNISPLYLLVRVNSRSSSSSTLLSWAFFGRIAIIYLCSHHLACIRVTQTQNVHRMKYQSFGANPNNNRCTTANPFRDIPHVMAP